jgi:hypothetical protein
MYQHADGEADALADRYRPEPGEYRTPEAEAAYRAAFDADVRPWVTGYAIVFSAAGALALTGAALLVFDPEEDAAATAATSGPSSGSAPGSSGPQFAPLVSFAPQGLTLGGTLRF